MDVWHFFLSACKSTYMATYVSMHKSTFTGVLEENLQAGIKSGVAFWRGRAEKEKKSGKQL